MWMILVHMPFMESWECQTIDQPMHAKCNAKSYQACTSVVLQLLLVHVDDIGTYAVHEVLGMRDHEQNALEALQSFLQPDTCLQVQMIGWLIKDQEGWINKQRPCQSYPHPPAS